ncbi:MAG: zinc ribbon domain-containing protein [Promethearchaeota archaeon]
MSKGFFCHCCGKPIEKTEDFGTNANGSKNSDYCQLCFQNGKLTHPELTTEQMIEVVASILARQMNISKERAKEKARKFIHLRR